MKEALKQLQSWVQNGNIDQIYKTLQFYKAQLGSLKLEDDEARLLGDAMSTAISLKKVDILILFLQINDAHGNKIELANLRGFLRLPTMGIVMPLVFIALELGNLPIVNLLIEHKADITTGTGRFPFDSMTRATQQNHLDIVEYLLYENADVDRIIDPMFQITYLSDAAKKQNEALVHLLITHGAQPSLALEGLVRNYKFFFNNDDDESRNKTIYKLHYQKPIQLILDYAIGTDMKRVEDYDLKGTDKEPPFLLKGLDGKGLNFIGLSYYGQPITREFLKTQGLINFEQAIVTSDDLERLKDSERRGKLKTLLSKKLVSQGKLITDSLINLAPLPMAILSGDIKAIETRLAAGVSPNYFLKRSRKTIVNILDELAILDNIFPLYILIAEYTLHPSERKEEADDEKMLPIVFAAKKGHLEIVDLLFNHPTFNRRIIPTAEDEAKQSGHQKIVDYFSLKKEKFKQQLSDSPLTLIPNRLKRKRQLANQSSLPHAVGALSNLTPSSPAK